MNLERLANESFLELFEYLDSIHLLRGFSHLNFRFDSLLITHFRMHGLDFRSTSKDNFDLICRLNLPSMIKQIVALHLSDGDDTPHQIDLFLSHGFTLPRFIYLHSLSISNVCSNELVSKLVSQCRQLPLLTRLEFIKCTLKYHRKTLLDILNRTWRLSKLTRCKLDWTLIYKNRFPVPTIRSKTIEYLSIGHSKLKFFELVRLFRCTPNIRNLTVGIDDASIDRQFPAIISSISSLHLHVIESYHVLINLLQNLTNLTRLTIISEKINMNGHEWKELIENYLPKLNVFRLQIHYKIAYSNSEQEVIDRILDSYRSSFWLIDRQWFVRCWWKSDDQYTHIFLYTLPYSFDFFALQCGNYNPRNKSTCPSDDNYWLYDRVKTLHYDLSPFNDSFLSHIRFNNVTHLEMELPFCNRFLSIFPRMNHVTSLRVSSAAEANIDLVRFQLQTLIDRTPRLYSLAFGGWTSPMVQALLLKITSNSVRQLDLQSSHYPRRDRCFTTELCTEFLSSPLANQCEVLLIVIDDQRQIFDLIKKMPKLQALKVECQSDHSNDIMPTVSELLQWIDSGFSRAFLDDICPNEIIRLWIR